MSDRMADPLTVRRMGEQPEQPKDESTSGGEWLTVAEAADVLNVSQATVRNRAKRGELECREPEDGPMEVYVSA